ncbi:peptide ABC transporter substrate-binding protein [Solemya pervernicosa gill symbiont]|uniref:Peptide ABC transporter substrate-binding protein n=2 Tax=Gammaproteobacteria incertae sedis TaxID=118884 RepID=A0A1T2LAP0_9GAMM|nr:ABC transporter substrate-binding protein [Candidatus Reidiella endopervernicosa]OOZ42072.1 peptide ABC transporter substrate-binding protein [Solemya pervernicosa gill symbiont]QKQ27010.1 ABC transporter substrate-binding protein [Candidatus Reidiella endopervernicosa]
MSYFRGVVVRSALLLLLVLLSGCSERETQLEVRFGISSAPLNLDPRFATDATSERINRLLYQPLVEFDEAARPVPAMARWERLTPNHYRFYLKVDRAPFINGRRPTADDVLTTYANVLNPATASPHRTTLERIVQLRLIDAETIDFHIKIADPLFPAYLTLGILPAELIKQDHDFSHSPQGSGPFKFADWPEEGNLALMRRRDHQLFRFLRVADPTVRLLKLMHGEIDMVQNDLPPELIGYLKQQPEIAVTQRNGINFSYLGLNLSDKATAKLKVRRAIAHAIDRQTIIRTLFNDGAVTANAMLPTQHWSGYRGNSPYRYDPAAARALLTEAGYGENNRLKLVYKSSSDPLRLRLATVLQHQLQAVGIDLEIRSYDWSTLFGDIKAGRFQLYSLAWVGIRTPDIFRYAFHSESLPPSGANRGRFIDHTADHLIESAETSETLQGQAQHYRSLQQYLLEQLPYIPLWYEHQTVASRRFIKGYRLAADGNYDGLTEVVLER